MVSFHPAHETKLTQDPPSTIHILYSSYLLFLCVARSTNYPFQLFLLHTMGSTQAPHSAQLHSPPSNPDSLPPCSLTMLTYHAPSPSTTPATTITTPALTGTTTAFTITTAALESCRISPTPRRPSQAHPRLPWGGGRRGACRTRCPGSTTTCRSGACAACAAP